MDFSSKINTVLACILLFFALRGAWRGLSGELSPLIALAIGIGFAWFSYHPIRNVFTGSGLPGDSATFYAALLVLVATLSLFIGLRLLLRKALKIVIAQPFDAMLGAFLGSLKVIILASIITGVYETIPQATPEIRGFATSLASPWRHHFASPEQPDNGTNQ